MSYGTDGLTFNTLRGGNMARVGHFKNSKGEVAHNKDDGSDWTPAQWLQALVGEVGEYANFRKKFERGDITEEQFLVEARKELADIAIYLDLLAAQLGIDLGAAVMDKFNEVSKRVGSPIYLDAEDWHYRKVEPEGRLSVHPCDKCGAMEVRVEEIGDSCDCRITCHACGHSYCVDGIDS